MSGHQKVIDYGIKIQSLFRPHSCHAKLMKTIEEGKIVHYVLLSYVSG